MSPYGCRGLVGDETPEGNARLARVWDEVEKAIVPYYHQWRPTDMLVWDNWRMLHEACGCDPKYERIMHRTTIKGDYGFGRWETEPKHLAAVDAMA
jgi:taurine dioxygenase